MKAGRARRFQAFFAFGIDFSAFFGYTINRRDTVFQAASRNDPVTGIGPGGVSYTFTRVFSVLTFPAVTVIIIPVEAFSVGDKPGLFAAPPALSEMSLLLSPRFFFRY